MNGTLHCIHPDLVCDGHPVCDNNEDEKIGTLCSIEKLIKLNIIKPQATKLCISKMYADKNMMTVAVACDGIEECEKGADESWLCTNSSYLVYGTLCVFLILILLLIVYKLLKGNRVVDDFQPLELQDILDTDIFIEKHDQKIFRDDINLFIQKSKVLDSKSDRIAKNKKLYDLESKFHGGNVAEIRLCIKNKIEWSNAKILIEDAFPGFLRKNFEPLENFLEELDRGTWTYWLLNKVRTIFNIYLDITKDTLLMISILIMIGGTTSLYTFPFMLTSVVVYCFVVTIGMPLCHS